LKPDADQPTAEARGSKPPSEDIAADVQELCEQGAHEARANRLESAETLFSRALDLDPDHEGALYGKAFCLRVSGHHAEAEAVLTQGLARHPGNEDMLAELGVLHFELAEYAEAVAAFQQLVDADPDDVVAATWKVRSLRAARRFEDAEAELGRALHSLSESVDLQMERGLLFIDLDRYPEATAAFDRVLELDESHGEALVWKIESLRLDRRYESAEQLIRDALAEEPANVELLLQHGWLAIDARDYAAAAEAFERVLSTDASNADALVWRTTALRLSKRFADAEEALAEAFAELDDSLAALNERGWLDFDQERYVEAARNFDEVISSAVKGSSPQEGAFEGRAASLRLARDFENAGAVLEHGLSIFPSSGRLLDQLGWLYFDRKQYEDAIGSFDRALDTDPYDDSALDWKIRSLRFLRRFEEAARTVRTGLEALPESVALWNQQGWLSYDQKGYEEAIEAFDRALELDGLSASAHEGKAASLRFLRRFDEAEECLDAGLVLLPESVAILNQRAWLHFDLREYGPAVATFRRVLTLDPNDEAALQWRIAALRRQRKYRDAEEAVSEGLGRLPHSSAIHIERGWLHFDQKRYERAERAFAKAAELAPGSPQPLLAQLHARAKAVPKRSHDDTVRVLRQSFADDPTVRDELGWFHIGERELEDAEVDFNAILAMDGGNPLGTNGMGGIYYERGEFRAAEREFRKTTSSETRYSEDPLYLCNLAWALAQQGSREKDVEAEELCWKALQVDSHATRAYECLSHLAVRTGDLRAAERHLLALQTKDPERGDAALGSLYVTMGRSVEARKRLERAMEADPFDATTYLALGNLLLEEDKPADAMHEFRRALALDPTIEETSVGLSIGLLRNGRPHEAERVLRDAIRGASGPNVWRLQLTLAWILSTIADQTDEASSLGRRRPDRRYYEEALTAAAQAKLQAPNAREPLILSGIIKSRLDDFRGAMKEFRACVQRDPDDYEASRHLETVRSWIVQGVLRNTFVGGLVIGAISGLQLIAVWALFLAGRISATVLVTLVPIFIGLIVVAFLLPSLIRLRLPGLDAQLSEPQHLPLADRGLQAIDWRVIAFTRPSPSRETARDLSARPKPRTHLADTSRLAT
jgi:tetratricopeptide (TPR) repeat protein